MDAARAEPVRRSVRTLAYADGENGKSPLMVRDPPRQEDKLPNLQRACPVGLTTGLLPAWQKPSNGQFAVLSLQFAICRRQLGNGLSRGTGNGRTSYPTSNGLVPLG